jgi:hypothetical protein
VEQKEQDDDRDGDADRPEQDAAHMSLSLLTVVGLTVAGSTRRGPLRFRLMRVAPAWLLLPLLLASCADPDGPASLHARLGGDLDIQQTIRSR